MKRPSAAFPRSITITSSSIGANSPGHFVGVVKRRITGTPDLDAAHTCYVERQNLTIRMGMRRFTRLTNAFSKKATNLCSAVALHFGVSPKPDVVAVLPVAQAAVTATPTAETNTTESHELRMNLPPRQTSLSTTAQPCTR